MNILFAWLVALASPFTPSSLLTLTFTPKTPPSAALHSSYENFGRGGYDDDEYGDGAMKRASVLPSSPGPLFETSDSAVYVPKGDTLILTEDNVRGVLQACREEISSVFGYLPENREVGITGRVEFVDLDGPDVVLELCGRFWHERRTVLARVASYLKERIPEIVDVVVDDEASLIDAD